MRRREFLKTFCAGAAWAAELNAKLSAWLKAVGAKLPKPNPAHAKE